MPQQHWTNWSAWQLIPSASSTARRQLNKTIITALEYAPPYNMALDLRSGRLDVISYRYRCAIPFRAAR